MPSDTPTERGTGLTRGFLFADLRGYTAFADRHGDRAAAALLARYRVLVRAAVAQTSGAEIRTEGDSFFIVFESVSSAIRCGLMILESAAEEGGDPPIRVGIGVHAGETELTDEGPVGASINVAARLCAIAGPGEMVASDTVRSLTRTAQSAGFVSLGSRRLKGVAEPMTVFRVVPRDAAGAATSPAGHPGALRSPRAAAGIAVLVAAVLLGAIAAARGGAGPGAAGPTSSTAATAVSLGAVVSPSATLTATPGPSLPIAATIPSPGDPFPTDAEAALMSSLRLLPAAMRGDCARGPYGVLSGYDGRAIPRASVLCAPASGTGASTILIRKFAGFRESGGPADFGVSVVGNIATGRAGRADDLLPGDCSKVQRATGRWEIPSVDSGSLVCYREADSGDAVLWWTYDGKNVIVEAVNRRGDGSALYEYFDRAKVLIAP